MSKVDITTPAAAAKKEALRVQILTNPVTSTDRTGYTMALSLYRKVCIDVRQLLGMPEFRGGFEEWAALVMDSTLSKNTELHILARRGGGSAQRADNLRSKEAWYRSARLVERVLG